MARWMPFANAVASVPAPLNRSTDYPIVAGNVGVTAPAGLQPRFVRKSRYPWAPNELWPSPSSPGRPDRGIRVGDALRGGMAEHARAKHGPVDRQPIDRVRLHQTEHSLEIGAWQVRGRGSLGPAGEPPPQVAVHSETAIVSVNQRERRGFISDLTGQLLPRAGYAPRGLAVSGSIHRWPGSPYLGRLCTARSITPTHSRGKPPRKFSARERLRVQLRVEQVVREAGIRRWFGVCLKQTAGWKIQTTQVWRYAVMRTPSSLRAVATPARVAKPVRGQSAARSGHSTRMVGFFMCDHDSRFQRYHQDCLKLPVPNNSETGGERLRACALNSAIESERAGYAH